MGAFSFYLLVFSLIDSSLLSLISYLNCVLWHCGIVDSCLNALAHYSLFTIHHSPKRLYLCRAKENKNS